MQYLLLWRNQFSGLEAMDFNINNGKYLIGMEEWRNALLDRRGDLKCSTIQQICIF